MPPIPPPEKALAILRWFCREDYLEEIEGDLIEVYQKEHEQSPRLARWKSYARVVRYFRPGFIKRWKRQPNTTGMYKNYILIGWRNLRRDAGYSWINVGGLAIGMAFALLIGLWIQYEFSYDTFHKKGDRIALVLKNTLFNNEKNTQDATPFPLAEELKNSYPEVIRASKVSWLNELNYTVGNKTLSKYGIYADPDFLKMFSFKLLKGDINTALNEPNAIILTESFAKAMFGDDDPIGKAIRIDHEHTVQVTGVIENVPPNSTIFFDCIQPYEFQVRNSPFIANNRSSWSNNFLMTMVELKDGVSPEAFSNKISKLNMEKDANLKNQYLFLNPLPKWHLEGEYKSWENVGGRIRYVRLFGVIGIFVLLIACVNFMNLTTARAQKRAKEVGIRKTVGSYRRQIIGQFLSESLLTTCVAFVLSLLLIVVILPFILEFGFEHIHISLNNSSLFVLGGIICLATGLLAGSYPAFYLSSLRPVNILKGLTHSGGGAKTFRRVLVTAQFAISIALIVCTIAVFQQVNHARHRAIGYNPQNLVSITPTAALTKNFHALKQSLLQSGYVEAVATASSPLTAVYNKWSDFSWDGKEPGTDIAFEALMTEWDFEKVAQLTFKQGRPFSIEHATDSNAVILNETALKVIGYKDPIGRTMKSGNREVIIVGVVEDMLMLDPFKSVAPGVILFSAQSINAMLIRMKDGADIQDAMAGIDPVVRQHNDAQPYVYSFVADEYNKKFNLENQVGKLSAIFAGLAIFISCLGLLGLTSFMAEQRVKEIGIRKILGASMTSLWGLLSKELIMLIGLSFALVSPVVYYFVDRWLQNYDYHITLSWWTFVCTGVGVLLLALSTVCYQSIKVVLANPVRSLRSE
jgi:putative ABC transport system permease protein